MTTEVSDVMKSLHINGLKGHPAVSPGHRPGYKSELQDAPCKGKSLAFGILLMPFQGETSSCKPYPGCYPGLTAYSPFRAYSGLTVHSLFRAYSGLTAYSPFRA